MCINCTLIEGSANNVTQFNIDVLNAAQQSLAQECVNEGFPATFTGTFAKPTTVAYPSGIDKATFIGGSSSKPVASATASANSSAKANATNPAAPSVSGKLDGSASALSFSAGAVVVAAAAALLL